ncbi:hypothetical protein [Succiniclasticum ruminis]|uniref:Uncharacterized protein n=1 Tax=Succiniclasticum ruminis DSM 9236 TaxID=1123323 RepID=A0A1I2BA02_9FIRM|nr:hypothetical protein [Succiniclasticum ruminis]SFE52728.1 hypothetical protein SAMN05216245_10863 [Succiniclasticum ruminis DSM 9236]
MIDGINAEKKTARMNVLVRQSVKDNASKIAYMQRETLNAVTDKLLEKYVADHRDALVKYHEVFGEA